MVWRTITLDYGNGRIEQTRMDVLEPAKGSLAEQILQDVMTDARKAVNMTDRRTMDDGLDRAWRIELRNQAAVRIAGMARMIDHQIHEELNLEESASDPSSP